MKRTRNKSTRLEAVLVDVAHFSIGLAAKHTTRVECTRCHRVIDIGIVKAMASPGATAFALEWYLKHPARGRCR